MTDPREDADAVLPPELRRFVAAESARPEVDEGKDAMRDRLAASLGLALAAPSVSASSASGAANTGGSATVGLASSAPAWVKAAVLVAVGFGAGFGSHVALEASSAPKVVAPIASSASATLPAKPLATEASSVIDSIDVSNLPAVAPTAAPIASATTNGSAASKGSGKEGLAAEDAEAERLLLETARVALRRGDREGALALLEQHKRRFPRGQLREERDGLLVSALTQLGRTEEAAKAAARFRKDYPMSLQGAAMPTATATP